MEDQIRQNIVKEKDAIDLFTGLLHKTVALKYAKELIEQSNGQTVTLCMIDLDKFKDVNDSYGHMFGDSVICKTADILKEAVKGRGIAAHFGGDEFFLVLEGEMLDQELRDILRYIRAQLAMAFSNAPEQLVVTCSIGVSQYPKNGVDFDSLFRKADRGLYIAKMKGRNRYILYKEELHGELSENPVENFNASIRQEVLNTNAVLKSTGDVIVSLIRNGADVIPEVLEAVRKIYGFDRVAIYGGADMHRIYVCGEAQHAIPQYSCILFREVQDLFDENSSYFVNMDQFNTTYISVYHDMLKLYHIRETLQYLVHTKEEKLILLSFENQKVETPMSQMPSDDEVHFLTIFARVLGEIIGNREFFS